MSDKEYIHRRFIMYVKEGHPHEGEICYPIGDTDHSITCHETPKGSSYLMQSENGQRFYARQNELMLIRKTKVEVEV